jgi:hypothetical protein
LCHGQWIGQTVNIRDPYPGNIIPTTGVGAIDALANKFATGNYWPAPKNPGGGYNFNTTSAPTTSNEWGIRIDTTSMRIIKIYGQFSNKHEGKVQTGAFYGNDIAGPYVFDPNNRLFGVLGILTSSAPTLVLSTDLFFTRNPAGNVVQGYPFKPSSLGLPGLSIPGRRSFRRLSSETPLAARDPMLPWERRKTPAKPPSRE